MTDVKSKKLTVSIKTFGCQMNVYDTEVAEGLLAEKGFQVLQPSQLGSHEMEKEDRFDPGVDVILMNTCSVREHAEDRVFGRLGMLGKAKEKNPDLIVGLMGCMVEEHRQKLFKRFPQLDLMVGTRNVKELPALIEEVQRTRQQVARIKQEGISIEYSESIQRHGKFHAWLPIMTGCNKVCTFCIVPITRGSEVSMPAREVYREASRLVSEGVRWITLLGQNVNSYDGAEPSQGKSVSFPELLDSLCKIEGLERISFTTSHPQDATEELFQVIRKNPKISRHFHLPLQSGSDRILKRMKRLHRYEEYKSKIDRLRELVPDIVVSTDLITGFSGETKEDHEATCRALEDIRYESAYIYKYSVRPGTPASKLEDDVPIDMKAARHAELIEIQRRITNEVRQQCLGQIVEVFVEDFSTKDSKRLLGRSNQEKKIIFPGEAQLLGTLQNVKINGLQNETVFGEIVTA